MFDHFLGKGHYTTIFCGQGELRFQVAKELSERTDEYLYSKSAGAEYTITGKISEKQKRRSIHLISKGGASGKYSGCQLEESSRTTGQKNG